ncbi:hypothetical protein XYCOK13_04380 [Xylanibacillus composti]|uniref:Uncharacterized protein n=2 Tax=Xylanibacillus composti TaxID=1572762 RepID=A0A8J4H265_9BACL|nr:hypothetical protein XYCOK13_04380 [Xylanibacillus composti]
MVWMGIAAAIGFSWMQWGNDRFDVGGKAHAAELVFEEADAGFRYGLPMDPARIARYYKKLSNDLGEFFIYMYKYKEGFYAGADIGGQLFELAEVGYGTNPELIELDESMLFGVPSIRVRGYCGMACPTVDYITVKDGYPYVWLHVDAAVQEYDLDQDGVKDLITTVGTPLETHIYMMKDGVLLRASVNEALHSKSVSFFQDGRFIAYEPNSALTRSYRFQDGVLVSK